MTTRTSVLSEWVYARRSRPSEEVCLHRALEKAGREETASPGGYTRGMSDGGDASGMADMGWTTTRSS